MDEFLRAFAVIVSVIGVIYAIRGRAFEHRIYRQRLALSIDTSMTIVEDIECQRWRYLHLTISNRHRWIPARNVMVYLRRLEYLDANDHVTSVFRVGPVPLLWQFTLVDWLKKHRDRNPDNESLESPKIQWQRDIGPERICDFGYAVRETSVFTLCTAFDVANLKVELSAGEKIRAFIDAEGDDAISNGLIVEVEWDGVWHENSARMKEHLIVTAKEVRPFSRSVQLSGDPYVCRCG